MTGEPAWLAWARRLKAIAQTGLEFGESEYDLERYREVLLIADEVFARQTEVDHATVADLLQPGDGYATPQVDVRAGVFQEDGRVLLVQERLDGLWTLPGGYADVNDAPSTAVEREVREESGYEVRAIKLAMLYDKRLHAHPPSARHTYKIFFLCDLLSGNAATSFETTSVGFFQTDNLPDLSRHRVTADQIRRLQQHWRHPHLPADFD